MTSQNRDSGTGTKVSEKGLIKGSGVKIKSQAYTAHIRDLNWYFRCWVAR